jgi:hypothetical protein
MSAVNDLTLVCPHEHIIPRSLSYFPVCVLMGILQGWGTWG